MVKKQESSTDRSKRGKRPDKSRANEPVYQLKITLNHIRPPIWRRLLVTDCTLAALHEIIQTAMGWESMHLAAFEVQGEPYDVQMFDDGLDAWNQDDTGDAGQISLGEIANEGITRFQYTYDFGDSWEHTITIEKTLQADPDMQYPRCIKGKRACPPEDCGGIFGYDNLLNALADPDHPEHDDMLDWCGEFDPEHFDCDEVNGNLPAR